MKKASVRRRRPRLGRVIASRTLTDEDNPKAKVVVSIGVPRPEQLAKYGSWECPFLIDGTGESRVQLSHGADAMQALIQALAGIRYHLKISGRNLQWLDSRMETGFPMLVQTTFGKGFEDRVGLAVERETIRGWRKIIKERRQKIAAHEARVRSRGISPSKIAREVAALKKHLDDWEAWINKLKPGWNRIATKIEARSDGARDGVSSAGLRRKGSRPVSRSPRQ